MSIDDRTSTAATLDAGGAAGERQAPDPPAVGADEASGADREALPHDDDDEGGGVAAALRFAVRRSVPILAAIVGIVVIWLAVSYGVLDPARRFLLPPPQEVLLETLPNGNVMSPMLQALWQTVSVAVIGLGITVAIGLVYATVMSQWGFAEKVLYPYAVILQTIPILALTPLIGIWMGYGFSARVVVTVIIALFPMISNTLFGLQSASGAAHDLFTLNRASSMQRILKLQFPAALPSIFTGLRQAAGLAVIGAIVGDFFFQQGDPGIGGLLRTYTLRLNMEPLFMSIILTALFGVAVFSVFAALDSAVIGRWYGRGGRR